MASANHKRPGFLRQVAMTASRHDSPDRRGKTVLPHSSKLSSPLVEPVAYPLGFSYRKVRACPCLTAKL